MKFKKAKTVKSKSTSNKLVNKIKSLKNKTSKENKLKKQLTLEGEVIIKNKKNAFKISDSEHHSDNKVTNYVSSKVNNEETLTRKKRTDKERKVKKGNLVSKSYSASNFKNTVERKNSHLSNNTKNYVTLTAESEISDLKEENGGKHLKEKNITSNNVLSNESDTVIKSSKNLKKKRKSVDFENTKSLADKKPVKCAKVETEVEELQNSFDKENKKRNLNRNNVNSPIKEQLVVGDTKGENEIEGGRKVVKKKHVDIKAIGSVLKKAKKKSGDEINLKRQLDTSESDISKADKKKQIKRNLKKNKKPLSNIEYSTPEVVEDETVTKGVDALLKLNEITSSKKALFNEETVIYLQIICVKIPQCPDRVVRFKLPHSLVTATSEVCLIVSDKKKGKRFDHEPHIEYWKDLLEEKGITEVKTVLPMRQLKTEFDQYEMKRRLKTMHDFFLVDAKISGHVCHILGRVFRDKNVFPTPIKINKFELDNLKDTIKSGLHKTPLRIHSAVHTASLRVGHLGMKRQQLCENIKAVIEQLNRLYPGGSKNIRAIHIKTPFSLSIPLYITLKPASSTKAPIIEPKRPKLHETVEDELSTRPGARVQVFADGHVNVIKMKEGNDHENLSE